MFLIWDTSSKTKASYGYSEMEQIDKEGGSESELDDDAEFGLYLYSKEQANER